MSDTHDSFRRKVDDIFRELVGAERAKWLEEGVASRCTLQIAQAVTSEPRYPEKVEQAKSSQPLQSSLD